MTFPLPLTPVSTTSLLRGRAASMLLEIVAAPRTVICCGSIPDAYPLRRPSIRTMNQSLHVKVINSTTI